MCVWLSEGPPGELLSREPGHREGGSQSVPETGFSEFSQSSYTNLARSGTFLAFGWKSSQVTGTPVLVTDDARRS